MVKKIAVIGCPGSGKSTLSRQLAKLLGLPVYHLDQLFWLPNWQAETPENFQTNHQALLEKDAWIIDGNFASTLMERVKACDMIIWLDYPRYISLVRVIKRVLNYHGTTRPDMAKNCPEQLDWEFLVYIWQFNQKNRPIIETVLEENPEKTVIHLTKPQEVTDWLRKNC